MDEFNAPFQDDSGILGAKTGLNESFDVLMQTLILCLHIDWLTTTVVSCSIAVQLPTGIIQSHTCTGIPINSLWISHRGQVMVVTISTLLTALRNTIESPGAAPIEQQYIGFLTHPLAHPEVSVATSRVPDFTLDSIQKPVNGYRYLGLLAGVPVGFTCPSATWDPSHDILAVYEIGQNPDSRDFAHVWEPCQLGTHFIIIFIHPPLTHTGHPSPISY